MINTYSYFNLKILVLVLITGKGIGIPTVCAQDLLPKATHYSVGAGLADWTVTGLTQDPSGMLWVSTHHGLQRFDGETFLTFNRSPENPHQISENDIEEIYAFRDSFILLLFANNRKFIDLLNHRTFANRRIPLSGATGIKGKAVTIVPDHTGRLFVLSIAEDSTHLYSLNARFTFDLRWSLFTPKNHSERELQLIPLQQADHFLFHDTHNGCMYVQQGNVLKTFSASDLTGANAKSIPTPTRASIFFRDHLNRVWVSFKGNPALYQFLPASKTFQQETDLPASGEYTYGIQDEKGQFLVIQTNGTGRYPAGIGIFLIDAQGTKQNLSHLLAFSRFPSSVYSKDYTGTIFWGMDTGLKIFQNTKDQFRHYLARNIPEDRFGYSVRGMSAAGKDQIYIAGESTEWFRLDNRTGKLDTLLIIDEATGEKLNFDCCMQVHYDGQYVWGTACQGLGQGLFIRYNPLTKYAKVFRFPARLKHFVPTADGKFLLVTFPEKNGSALLTFDPKTGLFQKFTSRNNQNPFYNFELNYLYAIAPNTYWIATNKGLYEVHTSQRTTRSINPDGKSQYRNFQVIQRAPDGAYWLGTTTGLLKYDKQKRKLTLFTKKEGLPNDWICGVLNDRYGNSWISTYHGISCYQPKSGQFVNFTMSQGLSHNSMNRFSFFKDARGTMYLGSINGLNTFNPDVLIKSKEIPLVVPTRFSWVDESTTITHTFQNPNKFNAMHLPPQAGALVLEFTLPSYYDMKGNTYMARMEGLKGIQRDWLYLGNQNVVRFRKLPPGKYTIRIKGADPQGIWTKQELVIPVFVGRYFYQNWWFIALCIALGAGLIVLLNRARWTNKLKMEQLRTKISSDIHDEVSGLLAGIAMQSELLNHKITDVENRRSISQITEVSRLAMYKLSDVLWSVDSRRDNLEDLLLRMREDAEALLSSIHIEYSFQVEGLRKKKKIDVQIRQDIYFIFKEVLNNIVKHSHADHVQILLTSQDQALILHIRDNGIGLKSHLSGHQGQGMRNIRMRAERLHGTFTQTNQHGLSSILNIPNFFATPIFMGYLGVPKFRKFVRDE